MANPESPTASLAQLSREIAAEQARVNRGEKIRIAIGVVLILIVCGYMTWLYRRLANDLTPQGVCDIAAGKFLESLPDFQKWVRDEAVLRADEIADQVANLALELPKKVRTAIQDDLQKAITSQLSEFTAQAGRDGSEAVSKQVQLIRTAPGASAEERTDEIMRITIHQFKQTATESTDLLYPQYAQPMRRIYNYLNRLKAAPDLTDEEKVHKELLQVTLILLPKVKQEFREQAEALQKHIRPAGPVVP